jgi:hypothetical protein
MKRSLALGLVLLSWALSLRAGEDPAPAAPQGAGIQRAKTEVTIDRKDQFVGGVAFGGPLGVHGTIGLLHGLGADVEEDADHVKAVCAAPIPHCAHGFLLEVSGGSGGGKVSLGLGGRARVDSEDFHGVVGADLKLSAARTWGSPFGTESHLTYLGPELDVSIVHVGVNLGVLWRVSGRGGSLAVFSWGLGVRL